MHRVSFNYTELKMYLNDTSLLMPSDLQNMISTGIQMTHDI